MKIFKLPNIAYGGIYMFKLVLYLIRDFAIMLSIFIILPLILQKIFNDSNLKTNFIVLIIVFIFYEIRTNGKKYKNNQH
jgi:hypothetical protein